MELCDPFLERMWILDISQAFDGDQVLANNWSVSGNNFDTSFSGRKQTSNKWKQARIDREMPQPPGIFLVDALQDDGTRAATALTTAQFRALASVLRSDEIQQRPFRVRIFKNNLPPIHVEQQ